MIRSLRLFPVCAAMLFVGPSEARPIGISISEVLYDAVGADDGKVFVELFGPPGTALAGFVLEGVNGADGRVGPRIPLGGVIAGDGFFVVADPIEGATHVAEADLLFEFDLQNGPDSLVLRAPDGTVSDAVGYGTFSPQDLFFGEGEAAPDAPSGSSLARVFADIDTDDNRTDFRVLASPTPGAGPTQIPEPSSWGLGVAGLFASILVRAARWGRGPLG